MPIQLLLHLYRDRVGPAQELIENKCIRKKVIQEVYELKNAVLLLISLTIKIQRRLVESENSWYKNGCWESVPKGYLEDVNAQALGYLLNAVWVAEEWIKLSLFRNYLELLVFNKWQKRCWSIKKKQAGCWSGPEGLGCFCAATLPSGAILQYIVDEIPKCVSALKGIFENTCPWSNCSHRVQLREQASSSGDSRREGEEEESSSSSGCSKLGNHSLGVLLNGF